MVRNQSGNQESDSKYPSNPESLGVQQINRYTELVALNNGNLADLEEWAPMRFPLIAADFAVMAYQPESRFAEVQPIAGKDEIVGMMDSALVKVVRSPVDRSDAPFKINVSVKVNNLLPAVDRADAGAKAEQDRPDFWPNAKADFGSRKSPKIQFGHYGTIVGVASRKKQRAVRIDFRVEVLRFNR